MSLEPLRPVPRRVSDLGRLAAQPTPVALSPAWQAMLLDPESWRESLERYARATRLAVALTDAQGTLLGACLNPQPTWQQMAAGVSPAQGGCPFSLSRNEPCTCFADALAGAQVSLARDRTGLVHVAVPLSLSGQPLGVVLAGQVFDQYPEQVVLEHVAKQLSLPPAVVWQKARLEYPVKQETLRVYADLLENLSQTFLQTRYRAMQEAERLSDMQRLQETSTRLISEDHIDTLLGEILSAAIAVTHADRGSLQLVDSETGELRLQTWQGVDPSFVEFVERVQVHCASAWGAALQAGRRVVVPDVAASDIIAAHPSCAAVFRRTDIRAMQSTPLIARSGRLLGILSSYWGNPHQPADHELHLLDVLARQAADLIERSYAEAALQTLNTALEQRVIERTAALEQAHEDLRREMRERQHMQEKMFEQEKLAALGTLLANVAHELNNPLAVAAMQLDNLQEEGASSTWREDLETLRQAVERCQSVVQSFLALARHQAPERHAVALNAVIGDVLVLLGRPLEIDGITIASHLEDDLPPLWADANQLHHVAANLITNAHHALRETDSPRHLKLTTAATADRSQVILEVADSGPGIPQDVQRRIFDPFFTTKPQGEGSGLGLPLCRSIVEGHGGSIHLVSAPGRGTTVSVILPAAASDVPPSEAAPEPKAPAQTRGGTILLIDDEPGVQRALRRLLQRSGHEVSTAANGQEGLLALETRSYEVILCDIRMPDLDGPGFYRELERRHPHLVSRVVFLTGDVLGSEVQDFFAQVGCPRLEKPFKVHEVRQVIQQMLATR
jgi:signal transduction histidine kinase/CheY-like chemotaxis protein/ligand-binding sensor protein